jgi:putative SOS response-associated peptidase YedK
MSYAFMIPQGFAMKEFIELRATHEQISTAFPNVWLTSMPDENEVLILRSVGAGQAAITAPWGCVPCYSALQPPPLKHHVPVQDVFDVQWRNGAGFERCIVLATSYTYQWICEETGKLVTYRLKPQASRFLRMAGIYRQRDLLEADAGVAVLTTWANSLVEPTSKRMPLILTDKDAKTWIGEKMPRPAALRRLFAIPESSLAILDCTVEDPYAKTAAVC